MDDDFNFGLDWDAWKAALPESVDMTLDFQKIKNNAQDVAIGNPTGTARMAASSINLNGMKPQALANMLNYLIRKGKAKVLSRPAVVAMNRQRATIASVDRIGYTTESQADKQAEVGITLTITPTIGSDTMSLAITANVNSLMGWGKNNSPLINTRSTTANVVLKDGEMFSLSGLRKDAMAKEDERIPFFGSIPLLGYFFRHEVDVKRTYEIVVLLTPKKVTPETGVSEKHKKLLEKTTKELETKRTDAQKFIDRVILNKAP
jgi:type II secretory pathway component GspD/PulD (secretin)